MAHRVSRAAGQAGPASAGPGERIFGLDLARAAAIAGVIVAHVSVFRRFVTGEAPPAWLPAFGHGVELFFALSGFLIGGLLLDILDREPSRRAWWTFMVRRWLRTVPLYLVCVVLLLILWPPGRQARPYVLEYFTFTQNLAWPMPNWFGVSWSLTVEEWFYLLFSLCVFAAFWLTGRRRAIPVACGLFIVASIAARLSLAPPRGSLDVLVRKVAAFRLDAIAYGVLAIWWCRTWPAAAERWRLPALAVGGALAVALLGPFATGKNRTVFALYIALVPASFALMLPAAATWRTAPRWVEWPVRWLSERSYCIYLVHLSLLFAMRREVQDGTFGPVVGVLLGLAATAVVADLSWRYFETPILRLRPKQFARPVGTGPEARPEPAPAS